ncbi:hypothetical protein C0995_002433 [Termitomyces sp. Mi166|nr:hypothetical protein C0995_002433 [Termitomyces sp. Mi166\
MPLRYIRAKLPRVDGRAVLNMTTTATALTKELSNMSFFPPATAAVSIVLLILETVQMEGRWDTVPPTLITNLEKFQDTLRSIHEFMKTLTDDTTWVRRFMNKTTIENALIDYMGQLDDASQSFQIAALIDIHYAVSSRVKVLEQTVSEPQSLSLAYQNPGNSTQSSNEIVSFASESFSNSFTLVEHPADLKEGPVLSDSLFQEFQEESENEIISDDVLDARGLPRYHQSEVRLKGRASVKGGWWASTSPAEVEGQLALIKRYEGPAKEALKAGSMAWMADVKLLQSVFHSNLPRMVGLSDRGAPTPFILLSYVQTQTPQALLLGTLKKDGLAACANLILHFYQDLVV